jgi:oligopeptide transport system permease protein
MKEAGMTQKTSSLFFEGAVYPGQEPFVAPVGDAPLRAVDSLDDSAPPTSMLADAWRTLRKNPMFIISAILILFIIIVALFPGLFTHVDPNYCTLDNFGKAASASHPFGFNQQGCDVFARTVYGARTSLTVGVVTTLLVILLGGFIGALGGFFGGWIDAVLSRLTDIFFAVPLVLGAIVVLQMFTATSSIWKVILVMVLFGWVSIARIARGAVIEAKNLEFNTASIALGSTPGRNLFRHVIPNAVAPVIVTGTTSLATYIVLEATLSFLGIGLPSSVVSWGGDISSAQQLLTTQPTVLVYPAAALVITVLSFILLGDAIKDALDPKSRTE